MEDRVEVEGEVSEDKEGKSGAVWFLMAAILVVVIGAGAWWMRGNQAADIGEKAEMTRTEVTPSPSAPPQPRRLTIELAADKGSTESGSAVLEEVYSGGVIVTLGMAGYPKGVAQPAHIHVGKCPDVGAVKYPLSNVVEGTSTTNLDVGWEALMVQFPTLAINVHKSVSEAKVYVACGDLVK